MLVDALSDKGFGFAVVQTVFEGAKLNTSDRLRDAQLECGLKMPFGHNLPQGQDRHPSIMEDNRTAGTPWFIVINPEGDVIYNDFRLDPARFLEAMNRQDLRVA